MTCSALPKQDATSKRLCCHNSRRSTHPHPHRVHPRRRFPERVFEVFTDIPRAAERIPGIAKVEMLSEVPFRIGTRWRETRVIMMKQTTEEMWVTGFEPPERYAVEAESHGTYYETLFEFALDGAGSKVT